MTDHHPPGEPHAVEIERQLADLVVENPGQPNDGEVWTYVAARGGYLPREQAEDEDATPCDDVGAVYAQTGAVVVRPVEEGR